MIKEIKIDEKNKWNETVRSFNRYEVYYLNAYVKALQSHGDGVPRLIYFENCNTRAINVVMKRKVPMMDEMYDFATPYGYGGFIVEGNDIDLLNKEYIEYCRQNQILTEFVRFMPYRNDVDVLSSLYEINEIGHTVYIDLTDKEKIWKNFSSKNRNVIRKAEKNGVEIHNTSDPNLIDDFMRIYNETMKRDEATDYYYFERKYYEILVKELKDNLLFFYASIDDTIIAISIMLYANKHMHYHLSASKKEYQPLAPTNLLLREAAYWGSNRGFEILHLGGGLGGAKDGLYKFKKAFNRENDLVFKVGKKTFDKKMYDNCIKGISSNSDFFPLYRK